MFGLLWFSGIKFDETSVRDIGWSYVILIVCIILIVRAILLMRKDWK